MVMDSLDALRRGMSFDDVSHALRGWTGEFLSAVISLDQLHEYRMWEYTPPKLMRLQLKLRLAFEDGKLLFWGLPFYQDTTATK